MRTLIDTNILVRYVLYDLMELSDEEKEAVANFTGLKSSERIVPIFILTEFTTIMNKVIPKKYNLSKNEDINIIFEITRDFIAKANKSYIVYLPDNDDIELATELFVTSRDNRLREKELSF